MLGFSVNAMMMWAHRRAVELRLTEPAIPIENAYVDHVSGIFRDEDLAPTDLHLSIARST